LPAVRLLRAALPATGVAAGPVYWDSDRQGVARGGDGCDFIAEVIIVLRGGGIGTAPAMVATAAEGFDLLSQQPGFRVKPDPHMNGNHLLSRRFRPICSAYSTAWRYSCEVIGRLIRS